MISEVIKTSQPLIHTMLGNELANDKLPHAFLISGNDLVLKKQLAILLAQSIIENNKGFACESCTTCKRVNENSYIDFIYIDGNKESIKKEAIEAIQTQFSKQAVEKANKKVYIINAIENTTIPGLNSLLKFLEEPNGETTFAILITNNINKLLPTIVSRCQQINLKPSKYNDIFNKYNDLVEDSLKAHYLARVLKYYDETMINNDEFEISFEYLHYFNDYIIKDLDYFLYLVESKLITLQDKGREILVIKYLLNMMYSYCKDIILKTNINDDWYNKGVYNLEKIKLENIMFQILNCLDNINKIYDHKLVFESLIYKIKGELYE